MTRRRASFVVLALAACGPRKPATPASAPDASGSMPVVSSSVVPGTVGYPTRWPHTLPCPASALRIVLATRSVWKSAGSGREVQIIPGGSVSGPVGPDLDQLFPEGSPPRTTLEVTCSGEGGGGEVDWTCAGGKCGVGATYPLASALEPHAIGCAPNDLCGDLADGRIPKELPAGDEITDPLSPALQQLDELVATACSREGGGAGRCTEPLRALGAKAARLTDTAFEVARIEHAPGGGSIVHFKARKGKEGLAVTFRRDAERGGKVTGEMSLPGVGAPIRYRVEAGPKVVITLPAGLATFTSDSVRLTGEALALR